MKTQSSLMIILMAIFLLPFQSNAQYFGQNKPSYESFDFNVTNSPNFSFYTYMKNDQVKNNLINWTEQWYNMHQAVLKDTFKTANPIIFYNNHAEFQQTNAIFGSVGVGTGGVTEGFKNRVIMPVTMINQQTSQVLGHELVHAYQYHRVINGDSTNLSSLSNLPLWMVEGMAEYLSLGRIDSYTSMWMRDAVLNDDIPSIKDLSNPKYFPYRYGQAFWSFFSGIYGDDKMRTFFDMTAKHGFDIAVDSVLHVSQKTLSSMYQEAIKTHYTTFLGDMKEVSFGKKILSEDNAGQLNIAPVVSPNGKYVIFFSDKNLFTTDLYLAEARTGKIIRKLNSLIRDGHIDDFSYLESAGTWSPNSKEIAYVAFDKGQNVIIIKDVESGKTIQTISDKKVKAMANPTWAPKGKTIVFSGMVEGQTDLFMYDLVSKNMTQLTDDLYSEVQANWNAEGNKIAFVTDRLSMDRGRVNGKWTLNIAEMDVETHEIKNLDIFFGADNTNPNYNENGDIYFLSDRDGFRNIYLYKTNVDSIFQKTNFKTGVSGIGRYSPALSASIKRDRIAFTHYFDKKYQIYEASEHDLLNTYIDRNDVDLVGAMLPVIGTKTDQTVMNGIRMFELADTLTKDHITEGKFKSKFKLDYITGSAGAGVSSSSFGTNTGLAGGVSLIFSDILGNHQLFSTVALNGEIYDLGGSVNYLNSKGRWHWGLGLSHIPVRTGFLNQFIDTSTYDNSNLPFDPLVLEENTIRIFQEQLSGTVQYPFSKTLRWEASLAGNARFYRYDKKDFLYNPLTGRYLGEGQREKAPLAEAEQLLGVRLDKGLFYNFSTAIVGDNSDFGLTAPLNGYRYRLDYSRYIGLYDFSSATADVRLYKRLAPVTLAFRAMHFSRFGKDANSFRPILIGDVGLVRGFNYGNIQKLFQETNENTGGDNPVLFNQLSGSKIIVTGFEVRLPFTGPKRLSTIKSNFLLTDLNLFFDAGLAFNDYEDIGKAGQDPRNQRWALSTGVSARINLFGAMILEPYYAFPLVKGFKGGTFGLNFVPGW